MKKTISFLMVAVLFALLIVATVQASPGADAMYRNKLRWRGVTQILRSIIEFKDDTGSFPAEITSMPTEIGSEVYNIDICAYLVPTYTDFIPWDPVSGYYTDCTNYETSYQISIDELGIVYISAPDAELGRTITVSSR